MFHLKTFFFFLQGLNRDNYRTLMQWDSSENGGFQNNTDNSTGEVFDPWVPVNADYVTKNVAVGLLLLSFSLSLSCSLARSIVKFIVVDSHFPCW